MLAAADPEDPGRVRAWKPFSLSGRLVKARLGANGILIQYTATVLASLECRDCCRRWPGHGVCADLPVMLADTCPALRETLFAVPFAEVLTATTAVDASYVHRIAGLGRLRQVSLLLLPGTAAAMSSTDHAAWRSMCS